MKDQEEQRSRAGQNRLAVAESPANPNETIYRQVSLQEGSRQASKDLPHGMAIIYQPSLSCFKEVLLTSAGWRPLAQEAASELTNSREKSDAGAGCDSSMPADLVRQKKYKARLTQEMDSAAEKLGAQHEKLLRERTEIESEPTIDFENQLMYEQERELAHLVSFSQYFGIPEMTELGLARAEIRPENVHPQFNLLPSAARKAAPVV